MKRGLTKDPSRLPPHAAWFLKLFGHAGIGLRQNRGKAEIARSRSPDLEH
jgi:hypothetical protein